MKELLLNKKILIAGAGGLLGSHLVVRLIEQGASVIAADIDIDRTRTLLIDLGIESNIETIEFIKLDITNEKSVKSLFLNDLKIDGAVNCTYPRNKTYGKHFFDVTLDSFSENLALHLGSAFIFSQQCAAYYLKNKTPFSLVNISSIYGIIAPNFTIYENTTMTMPVEYAAIKSALLHLNKYIVKYVNESDFRLNSVSPGGIFDHQPEEFLKAYKKETHGNGMLNVKSILGAIVFLLSDQSEYTVGQNIVIDDGFII